MLCWFLPYKNANQPQSYTHPLLPLPFPSPALPSPFPLPLSSSLPCPSSLPSLTSSQSPRLASLGYSATSHQLYLVGRICWCYSLHLSHSLPPALCSQVHSLDLRPHSFPANRFSSSIFLGYIYIYMVSFVYIYIYTYIHIYMIYV